MRLFVVVVLLLSSAQIGAQERFYIAEVYVQSDYDSTYVLPIASEIVPQGSTAASDVITCLKSELMSTGMFKEINTRLVARLPGEYELIITPKWKGNPDNYIVDNIVFDDSLGVQMQAQIKSRLDVSEVRVGRLFTPYSEIGRALNDVMNDLEELDENFRAADIWERTVLIKENQIRLVISKRVPLCPSP